MSAHMELELLIPIGGEALGAKIAILRQQMTTGTDGDRAYKIRRPMMTAGMHIVITAFTQEDGECNRAAGSNFGGDHFQLTR